MKLKILHIIVGLGNGGAENTLYKLTKNLKKNFDNVVLVLGNQNALEQKFRKEKIKLIKINIKNKYTIFFNLFKIHNEIKKNNPDLIQTWMYHSDIIGSFIGKLILKKKVIWCIRHSNSKIFKSKLSTIFLSKVCSIISYKLVDQIIYSSTNSKNYHRSIGYDKKKGIEILNGYDPSKLKFIKYKKKKTNILGHLANFRPQKDFNTLLKSLKLLEKKQPNFKCLMAGQNIDYQNLSLVNLIKKYNLEKKIYLLGQLQNTLPFFKKIDFLILSSSYGESFPNVIAEGMLQGIPCISTDVGDSKKIISNFGWISKPSKPFELSKKIFLAIRYKNKFTKKYLELKKKNRLSIINRFHIKVMSNKYSNIWKKIIYLND